MKNVKIQRGFSADVRVSIRETTSKNPLFFCYNRGGNSFHKFLTSFHHIVPRVFCRIPVNWDKIFFQFFVDTIRSYVEGYQWLKVFLYLMVEKINDKDLRNHTIVYESNCLKSIYPLLKLGMKDVFEERKRLILEKQKKKKEKGKLED